MLKRISAYTVLAVLSFVQPTMAADERPDYNTETLTGNWGGLRDQLYDQGYSFDLYYKFTAWRNFSGGAQQGNRGMDNLDLKMTVDGEKAFNSKGTTGFVYLLNNNGGQINNLVGSVGGVDNTEVNNHSFSLYEVWLQQEFFDDRVSILAGLHDLNSEFYVTDTQLLFLNPAPGTGNEFAITGDNGPSIFPFTSLAVRVAVKPTDNTYAMAAVFEGTPSDPDKPRGTHISFDGKEGTLQIAEGGIKDDTYGHFGVGAWRYTATRPDQLLGEDVGQNSQGYYFLADKSLYKDAQDRDISAFAHVGYTAGNVEQLRSNWVAGTVFSHFVPQRPDAQFGFMVSENINSAKYKQVNTDLEDSETQYEVIYSDKLTPWLTIQPDLQYTANPGTDPALHNAWTAGVRAGIAL